MRVLALTRYGAQGASSRMRTFQYLSAWSGSGIECVVNPLFSDELLLKKYRIGSYAILDMVKAYAHRIAAMMKRHEFDLVWIEKEALPWMPVWFEQFLLRGKPYVMDFDDALFHKYDLHRSALVRSIFRQRIDRLMAGARLVTAGNGYLAGRARAAGAQWVEFIPTVVDLNRYNSKNCNLVKDKPRIVWIGSPSTVQYLKEISEPLSELARRIPFTLRVIGAGELAMPGVEIENINWTAETEASALEECDIGIMPLRDTPWEQGKCAYKLIQYMACALPTVASPIGANLDVVLENETGFFASSATIWIEKLGLLLNDKSLRQRLGRGGRSRVESEYSKQKIELKLVTLLTETVKQRVYIEK